MRGLLEEEVINDAVYNTGFLQLLMNICKYYHTHTHTHKHVGEASSTDSAATPKEKTVAPLTIDGKPHLPFQLQIEYTGLDGSRCMRVITQAKPITRNRDVAERGTYILTS